MRITFVARAVLFAWTSALAGCLVTLVDQPTPIEQPDGRRAYSVRANYDMPDLRERAQRLLGKQATDLCGGEYAVTKEQDVKRYTAWGTWNGQIDLVWNVVCG